MDDKNKNLEPEYRQKLGFWTTLNVVGSIGMATAFLFLGITMCVFIFGDRESVNNTSHVSIDFAICIFLMFVLFRYLLHGVSAISRSQHEHDAKLEEMKNVLYLRQQGRARIRYRRLRGRKLSRRNNRKE